MATFRGCLSHTIVVHPHHLQTDSLLTETPCRQRNAGSTGLLKSLSAYFSKLLSQKSCRPQLPLLFVETTDFC